MNEESSYKTPRGRRSHRLWRKLVDSAHALLAIDSARQYGLIMGGPEIDSERCLQILEDGAKRGFRPSPNAVKDFLKAHLSAVVEK